MVRNCAMSFTLKKEWTQETALLYCVMLAKARKVATF